MHVFFANHSQGHLGQLLLLTLVKPRNGVITMARANKQETKHRVRLFSIYYLRWKIYEPKSGCQVKPLPFRIPKCII